VGEGTVADSGIESTHGLENLSSVVAAAIASIDPASGVSMPRFAAGTPAVMPRVVTAANIAIANLDGPLMYSVNPA
jgi:hypothetical protein